MKIKNRTKFVGARMTEEERKFIEREAKERGQRVSSYIRRMLLANMLIPVSDGKNNA